MTLNKNFFAGVLAYVGVALLLGVAAAAVMSLRQRESAPAAETAQPASAAPSRYESDRYGFSVEVPDGFTVDESYAYANLGPGREIPGIKFVVPAAMATGTNLSRDSYLSVEALDGASSCGPEAFLDAPNQGLSVSGPGGTWASARAGGAAAGNQYLEEVRAAARGSRCYGVRLFAHTTSIANYDPGTIEPYDEAALSAAYEALWQSFQAASGS